jgi:hypothetical protein
LLGRKRSVFAAQNYSILNHIALNLLKNEKTTKVGVRGKRLKNGWDKQYLIELLKKIDASALGKWVHLTTSIFNSNCRFIIDASGNPGFFLNLMTLAGSLREC